VAIGYGPGVVARSPAEPATVEDLLAIQVGELFGEDVDD